MELNNINFKVGVIDVCFYLFDWICMRLWYGKNWICCCNFFFYCILGIWKCDIWFLVGLKMWFGGKKVGFFFKCMFICIILNYSEIKFGLIEYYLFVWFKIKYICIFYVSLYYSVSKFRLLFCMFFLLYLVG